MKALTYHGLRDVRYDAVPDPRLTDPNDILVRVAACAICGSDLHIYNGHGFSEDCGFCLGHEAVGEVIEIGPEVRRLKVGDQVMISAAVGCGRCIPCKSGNAAACENGFIRCYGLSHVLEGCQAEAVVVPHGDHNAAVVPDGISLDQALMLTDNLPTAYLACRNAAVASGKAVAVVGLGPVGLMAVELALAMGADRVFALDVLPERTERARELGAAILPVEEAKAACRDATNGRLADCVIEGVGNDGAIRLAIDLAAKQGKVSSVGVPQMRSFPFPMALAFNKGLSFSTALCSVIRYWPELITMILERRIIPERFITHRMALSDGPRAYRIFDGKLDGALKITLDRC